MSLKEFSHFFKDDDDDDRTSGTSDFEESNIDNEPDDCYCEDALDSICISYAMGVDDSIHDLEKHGFSIIDDDGDYKVRFNWSNRNIYEEYIDTHIKDTYWNEYINLNTLDIFFTIKENNQLKHIVNHGFQENPELLLTCNRLCEGNFKTMKELIMSNDYYKEMLNQNNNSIDMGELSFDRVTILYRRWSTVGKAQYGEISAFWQIVEKYVNCSKLQGFGCDWTDTDFLYGIIFTDGNIPEECLNEVRNTFPDTSMDTDFAVPSQYNEVYEGNTSELDPLYDKIWSKGPLAYELEEFTDDGHCKISVIYKQPIQESVVRSNAVYTTANVTKIEDFPFDKAYFGSPNKLPSTMKLDGPFFITPYIGAASIFAVRPQHLQKYGVPRGININRAYKEWDINLKDTLLQEPLQELHVILQGAPDIKESVENVSGYIYTVDITPDIRNHIYQSDKMNKDMEFCIDKLDTIDFSNIQEVTVKMTVSGAPARIQESAYYQEASNKTKVTREKNKIKNDLNIDKNGFGKLIDKQTGKEILVKIEFDHNKPTHAKTKNYDRDNGRTYSSININPNDLERGHGYTKYLHEKNHIIQDLHKTAENIYDGNVRKTYIKYTRDDDISDEKLAKAFINKHMNEARSKHAKDPEEYIADLRTARKRGFNETIKMLQDMIYKESKTPSKSTKNNLATFKNIAKDNTSNNKNISDDALKEYFNSYKKILEEHRSKLKMYEDLPDDAVIQDIKREKEMIKVLEKRLSSFDKFKRDAIKGVETVNYEKLVDDYNSDLKLRILFLRDMKKIEDRNQHFNEGSIIRFRDSENIRDLYKDPLGVLIDNFGYMEYVESYEQMKSMHDHVKQYLESSFPKYNISDDLIDHTINYIILESLEYNDKDFIIQESKLDSKKRNELKDSDFALVYTDSNGKKIRKYPVHDEDHVRAAAKMFPRGVPMKYKKQVAHKILRKAHEFGIDTDGWNSVNAYKGKD